MKSTCATLFGLFALAAALPLQSRSCTDGALVCNGSSQFALCNAGSVVWQSVAAGTVCTCSGSTCTIEADTGDSSPATATADATPASTIVETVVVATPTTTLEATSVTSTLVANGAAVPSNVPGFSSIQATLPTTTAEPATQPATSTTAVAPATTSTSSSSGSGGSTYISTFLGDGDTSSGWPAQSEWLDFETLWSTNLADVISISCAQFSQTDNTADESANLKSAIQSVASSTGVDERFILAVVLQESGGCVRAPTTNYGVVNPGLMQSHDGSHSCYNVSPCSSDEITGMIQDGTAGTSSGPGLQQDIASSGATDVSMYYKAARIYNSGSIAANGLLEAGIATHCYSSDIANRLLGWSKGGTGCSV